MVAKTCQPYPRTSSRLRSNDRPTPVPSITSTGTITAQIVNKYKRSLTRFDGHLF